MEKNRDKAAADQLKGGAEESVGAAKGDRALQEKGRADRAKGVDEAPGPDIDTTVHRTLRGKDNL